MESTEQSLPDKEFHDIESVKTLKIIAHGLRMQIMHLLKYPRTVKELSEAVEIAQTKLYYHVNLLESHGLIHVVETNIVSGIIEKRYQAVARRYGVSSKLFGNDDTHTQLLETILTSVREDFRRSYMAGLIDHEPDMKKHGMLRSTMKIRQEDIIPFQEKFVALMREFDQSETENEGVVHALTFIMLPVPMEEEDNE